MSTLRLLGHCRDFSVASGSLSNGPRLSKQIFRLFELKAPYICLYLLYLVRRHKFQIWNPGSWRPLDCRLNMESTRIVYPTSLWTTPPPLYTSLPWSPDYSDQCVTNSVPQIRMPFRVNISQLTFHVGLFQQNVETMWSVEVIRKLIVVTIVQRKSSLSQSLGLIHFLFQHVQSRLRLNVFKTFNHYAGQWRETSINSVIYRK